MKEHPDINDILRTEGPDAVRARSDRAHKYTLTDEQRQPPPPLPYVDLARDLVPRQWLVLDRLPMFNVALLSGEGSVGKSLLLMQLAGAVVLGRDWIGTLPEQGPVLYVSCEEDDDEVRRRMESVAVHFRSSRAEMIEQGLRVLSFAGRDAILGQADRSGIIRPTPLFEQIRRDALQLRPKLIVLDAAADVFGGNEIDRAQTRQFITLQRGLAIDAAAAVVMAAHPSLTGIKTDTGLSGSTAWHNSVRARMYFKAAPGEDTALRVLEVKKTNYGPVSATVVLRWRDGVYVVEPGKGTFERLAAEAEIDRLFLMLLRRFTDQNRNVSDKVSPSYAPTVFAREPEAKESKTGKDALADAMTRLLIGKKIKVEPFGPASKMRTRIVEFTGDDATFQRSFQRPSNDLPTSSNGVCAHTPHTPPSVGRGKGALEAPAPPNAKEGAAATGDGRLASMLQAWGKAFGFGSLVTVPFLVHATEMDLSGFRGEEEMQTLKPALLAVAEGEPGRLDSARLEQWLRENSGVEAGHLTLRDAGTGKDGLAQWTVTLRVEPHRGSPSL